VGGGSKRMEQYLIKQLRESAARVGPERRDNQMSQPPISYMENRGEAVADPSVILTKR